MEVLTRYVSQEALKCLVRLCVQGLEKVHKRNLVSVSLSEQ